MAIIYETKNFILESHERPEIDRLEGGHVKISPKIDVEDRTKLDPKLAIELMRFTIVSGEAMKVVMAECGVNIGRINYQENGNWQPHLHVHIYCRAKDAQMQKYGEPLIPGYKDEYKSLNEEDIKRMGKEVEELFNQEKFSNAQWGL
jgi:diadenosine tetraphosphate (Ap4A) HIT family hydrolase